MNLKVEIELKEELLVDAFIAACEGGSNYWAQSVNPTTGNGRTDAYEMMLNGFDLVDGEAPEEGRNHTVTPEKIEKAVRLLGQKEYLGHLYQMLSGDGDAATGDVFLQLCVYGKVIYG